MTHDLTYAQRRAARAMLDWSHVELARVARISVSTVLNAEGREPGRMSDEAGAAIRRAFETAGVQFLPDDGKGAGLRLSAL